MQESVLEMVCQIFREVSEQHALGLSFTEIAGNIERKYEAKRSLSGRWENLYFTTEGGTRVQVTLESNDSVSVTVRRPREKKGGKAVRD